MLYIELEMNPNEFRYVSTVADLIMLNGSYGVSVEVVCKTDRLPVGDDADRVAVDCDRGRYRCPDHRAERESASW